MKLTGQGEFNMNSGILVSHWNIHFSFKNTSSDNHATPSPNLNHPPAFSPQKCRSMRPHHCSTLSEPVPKIGGQASTAL